MPGDGEVCKQQKARRHCTFGLGICVLKSGLVDGAEQLHLLLDGGLDGLGAGSKQLARVKALALLILAGLDVLAGGVCEGELALGVDVDLRYAQDDGFLDHVSRDAGAAVQHQRQIADLSRCDLAASASKFRPCQLAGYMPWMLPMPAARKSMPRSAIVLHSVGIRALRPCRSRRLPRRRWSRPQPRWKGHCHAQSFTSSLVLATFSSMG